MYPSSAKVWCSYFGHLRRTIPCTQTYEETARGTHTPTLYAPGPSDVTPHRSLIPCLRRHSYISPAPLLLRWCGGAGLRGRAWGAVVASFALAIAAAAPRRLLSTSHIPMLSGTCRTAWRFVVWLSVVHRSRSFAFPLSAFRVRFRHTQIEGCGGGQLP